MASQIPSTNGVVATSVPAAAPIQAVGALEQRQVVLNQALPNAFKVVAANALMQRTQRELQLSPQDAWKYVNEYLSFLSLKAICNDWDATKLSPSAKVDAVWHLHILDTKQYAADCKKLCKQMIHHNPDGTEEAEQPKRYANTLQSYQDIFKRVPPREIWPEVPADAPAAAAPAPAAADVVGKKRKLEQPMSVFILELTGRRSTISLLPDSTVSKLKDEISKTLKYPVKDQRLHFAGLVLEDEKKLSDYNIKKESTIQLCLRLKGC